MKTNTDIYQELRVMRIVDESWNTKSFYLRPADGSAIKEYQPGQHLLFSLPVDPADKEMKIMRFYTLSDSYNPGGCYRISIKHEAAPKKISGAPDGAGSNYFHKHIKEGDTIIAKGPIGEFILDPKGGDPVVLVAGGIGITPILAMAKSIAASGNSERDVWMFLGMRNGKDHPFKKELSDMVRDFPSIKLNICYDEAGEGDVLVNDYHYAERVSVDLFKCLLPHKNYKYYICGPRPMMDSITSGLKEWGVPDADVLTESFGPATATNLINKDKIACKGKENSSNLIEVTFTKSGHTYAWDSRYKCLLEFAEAKGVSINAGCLYGDCGTCMTGLRSGKINYNHQTEIVPDEGTCLPCSCMPATSIALEA
jgi:uncharacterized protein